MKNRAIRQFMGMVRTIFSQFYHQIILYIVIIRFLCYQTFFSFYLMFENLGDKVVAFSPKHQITTSNTKKFQSKVGKNNLRVLTFNFSLTKVPQIEN